MNASLAHSNEQKAAAAFNRQAKIFDEIYGRDSIVQYKRQRVRDHLMQFVSPSSNILELNCGTGEDAIWLAKQGHHVHAVDISENMLYELNQKRKEQYLEGQISYELCSFTELDHLKKRIQYDCIFSNFAGLNCTNELDKVLNSFSSLLIPGGIVTLVLLPKFCLWETLLLFKGKFKTAFRRIFAGRRGARAHIEGEYFRCWYYNPSFVIRRMKDFRLLSLEGLCTIVPPSYMEQFAEKRPKLFQSLKSKEDKLKYKWPWRSIGDYYIISLRKEGME